MGGGGTTAVPNQVYYEVHVESGRLLHPNTWYHLAMTCDGTTVKLYVNGVVAGTKARGDSTYAVGPSTAVPDIRLGVHRTGNGWFKGLMDDVRLYNRVLSAAEIGAMSDIPAPPVFEVHPEGFKVAAGDQVIFSAGAAGHPEPTYQWRLNGTALPGATSPTLTVTNVQAANAGTYDVVATNNVGTATSNSASLVIYTTGLIVQPPRDTKVPVGSPAVFSVRVMDGLSVPVSYQWFRNGLELTGATGSSYTTQATTAANDGQEFHVRATAGSVVMESIRATLRVLGSATYSLIENRWQGGSGGGNWHEAGNWSEGVVPSGGHQAVIGSGVVQVGDGAALTGTVVTLSGGTITGDYSVSGILNVSSGTLAGKGTVTSTGVVNILGTMTLQATEFINEGLVNHVAGQIRVYDTVIRNAAHDAVVGQWNLNEGAVLARVSAGEPTPFFNAGLLRKVGTTAGGEGFLYNLALVNRGTVEVAKGALRILGAQYGGLPAGEFAKATVEGGGAWTVAGGATLYFSHDVTTTFQDGARLNGMTGSNFVFHGKQTTFAAGSRFQSPESVVNYREVVAMAGGVVTPGNGTHQLDGSVRWSGPLQVPVLSLTSGSVLVGDFEVTGVLNASQGVLRGKVTVAASGTLNVNGGTVTVEASSLINFGAVNLTSGTLRLDGTAVENRSGATWTVNEGAVLARTSNGEPTAFVNAGLLRKVGMTSGGEGYLYNLALVNHGTVEVAKGALRILGATTGGLPAGEFAKATVEGVGAWTVAGGATLYFSHDVTTMFQDGARLNGVTGSNFVFHGKQTTFAAGSRFQSPESVVNYREVVAMAGGVVTPGNGTHQLDGSVRWSGPLQVPVLSLTSGSVLVGDFEVTGVLNASQGVLRGKVTVAASGTLNVNGGTVTVEASTLTNFGSVNLTSGTLRLDGTAVENRSGATWTVNEGSVLARTSNGEPTAFVNAGLLRKVGMTSGGEGYLYNLALVNHGTVEVAKGALRILGATTGGLPAGEFAKATVEGGGAWTVAGGATLYFSHDVTTTFQDGARLNGVTGSNFVFHGKQTTFAAGSRFQSPESVVNYREVVAMAGGVVTAGNGTHQLDGSVRWSGPLQVPVLSLTNGSVLDGDFEVTGVLNAVHGVLKGKVTVAASGTLNVNGGTVTVEATTLTNSGTVILASGTLRLQGTAVENRSGATWTINEGAILARTSNGDPTAFVNAGLLRKVGMTIGGEGFLYNLALVNRGTVEVAKGALQILGAQTGGLPAGEFAKATVEGSGSWAVAEGAALRFSGNLTAVYPAGTRFTGASGSSLGFAGTSTLFQTGSQLFVSGSTLTFNSSATSIASGVQIQGVGATFNFPSAPASYAFGDDIAVQVPGAQFNFSQAGPYALPRFSVPPEGRLIGNFTVSKELIWTGGRIGPGTITIAPTGTLTVSGDAEKTLAPGTTLNNEGTWLWSGAGSIRVAVEGGIVASQVNNRLTGTWEIQGAAALGGTGSGNNYWPLAVTNAGTIRKSAGAGTTQLGMFIDSSKKDSITNTGTIEVLAGELKFPSYQQTAGVLRLAGGNLAASQILDLTGGELTGAGIVTGNVTNAATVRVGTPLGRLTVTGNFTQTAAGTLALDLGGTMAATQFDQLVVTGQATLGGKLQVNRVGDFTPAAGHFAELLTYGSKTGAFANIEGLDFGVAGVLQPSAGPTGFYLALPIAPVITLHPASQSVSAGSALTLRVTVTGSPPPALQWRRGSVDLVGATNAVLALPVVQESDAGNYHAVATNLGGTATSNAAAITVLPAPFVPDIAIHPVSQAVNPGTTATFAVTAAGNPAPAYQWRRNGADLAGATGATLAVPNVQVGSAGSYSVVVSNTHGFVTSNPALLSVNLAPVITGQPQGLSVGAGANAVFTVVATGVPAPSFQWRRDGANLPGASLSTLALTAVTTNQAGAYTVVVANAAGNVTSETANLNVVPTGASASHRVLGSGYVSGGTVTIENTLSFPAGTAGLGWHVLLPAGWSYAGGLNEGEVKPVAGSSSVLEWSWTWVNITPSSPLTFSYVLNAPAGASGEVQLAALAIVRYAGPASQLMAQPDPLKLPEAPARHSADTRPDFRIDLFELTRVIELFNTRKSGTRTGCYKLQDGTEDGFAPDADRAVGVDIVLPKVHSADTSRDGRISLFELTRVIELFNTRAGSVRTGAYHVQAGTEDGFAPGP
jgi:hypothetical protein